MIHQQPRVFLNIHFTDDVLVEALLVVLDVLCRTLFQVGLGLPHHIPTYSDNVPIVLPHGLSLFPHPINFFLLSEIY